MMQGMTVDVEIEGEFVRLRSKDHSVRVSIRGGRILEYALGANNILSTWGDYVQQGSTFWLGPHHEWSTIWPPNAALDEAPYEVSVAGKTAVTFQSPAVEVFGIRIRKQFELLDDGTLALEYGVR